MISISGIRGIVGETMTPALAGDFGRAFGTYLDGGHVVVGRDSRSSGPELQEALVGGLCETGCRVTTLGIVSTPGTGLRVVQEKAAGGVVITASHNPKQWNGIKFLSPAGLAPPPPQAERIIQIYKDRAFISKPGGNVTGDETTHEKHVAKVLAVVDPAAVAGRKIKVVLDSINGAGGPAGRMLLEQLGCEIVHINAEPTGLFAHLPEPIAENLSQLCETVKQSDADIGFAQDPDADRLAVVDENGTYIGEEYTLALAAKYMFGAEPGAAVTNLSTSRMIDGLAAEAGPPCKVFRSAVGEANVVDVMNRHDAVIGGEGNGGVIDPRVVCIRDSLVAMALLLQLLTETGQPLSRIVAAIPKYSMVKQKFECSAEKISAVLGAVKKAFADQPMNDVDGVRVDWPEGWVHVRGSNTEPIMRIIAEADDANTANELVGRIRAVADAILKT